MASVAAVVHENGVSLDIPLLQPGGHLPNMRRIASIVPVTGDKQNRRVVDIVLDVVIRGIGV